MNNKHLSLIKQSASISSSSQPEINAKNKLDQFVDDLLKSDANANNTIAEILNNLQVRKHGILGRLSASQQSLVTSVVSIMQDRVSSDAKQNADALKQIIIYEREALAAMSKSFTATAKSLYRLPLIAAAKNERESSTLHQNNYANAESVESLHSGSGGGIKTPARLEQFLTWGNFLALTAIVLAVLVVKTSVNTANFETKYHLTQANLDQLTQQYEKLQLAQQQVAAENKVLAEKNATLSSRQDETDKQTNADRARIESDLQEAKQTIAKQQTLITQAEHMNNSIRQNLNAEIGALQQELAGLKGKETQQDEQDNVWKKLAEERKEEITKLQTQLLERQAPVTEAQPKSKFMGLF